MKRVPDWVIGWAGIALTAVLWAAFYFHPLMVSPMWRVEVAVAFQ